ncbi:MULTISPECIES: type II toxin-antitoxin system prevent-host-death family antitoxin [Synechococcales]|uniref:type II toxin-antitoxin system prevent-host-death family antitoxin n=1 Tax=Synechococcus sp. CS-1324 TaxID=2847980 RepID=UPI00223BF393|nr:type II toxin-antitoxin system prevent-host-death family antitoxin [Synechococcus sp. CS-1324]
MTRRGKPATVILGIADYKRLQQLERLQQPSLVELLLAQPQDDGSSQPIQLEPRAWEE